MIKVRIVCLQCKGSKYQNNINRETGRTACFCCKGLGYLWHEMDEDEHARQELLQMPKERLLLVDCDKYKWLCGVDGCQHGTTISDYGIEPQYFTRWGWRDLSERIFLCARHWKQYKEKKTQILKEGAGVNHLVALNDGNGK